MEDDHDAEDDYEGQDYDEGEDDDKAEDHDADCYDEGVHGDLACYQDHVGDNDDDEKR